MKTLKSSTSKTAAPKTKAKTVTPISILTPEIMAALIAAPAPADMPDDPTLLARLFSPVGSATWYLVSGQPDTKKVSRYSDDFICYGYAALDGENFEWGSISIKELEEVVLPLGLKIERDAHFRASSFLTEFGGAQ
jgi:hypothetical protein